MPIWWTELVQRRSGESTYWKVLFWHIFESVKTNNGQIISSWKHSWVKLGEMGGWSWGKPHFSPSHYHLRCGLEPFFRFFFSWQLAHSQHHSIGRMQFYVCANWSASQRAKTKSNGLRSSAALQLQNATPGRSGETEGKGKVQVRAVAACDRDRWNGTQFILKPFFRSPSVSSRIWHYSWHWQQPRYM